MQDLRLALVQADLHWNNPEANRAMLEELLWPIQQKADLILLPEMFTTGFSMDAAVWAEHPNGLTAKWLKQMAAHTQALVGGSYAIRDGNKLFNRFVVASATDILATYDKRHLFGLAGEHAVFRRGARRVTFQCSGWTIMPQICYDLRFPIFSRNDLGYHLLLYVANWPQARIAAWDTLLQARAIENQCFVAGVNRTGLDGNSFYYPGHSQVIDYSGAVTLILKEEPSVAFTNLSGNNLLDYRNKFPFLEDKDSFQWVVEGE
jgi:predicted amidohydrolase